MPSARLPLAQLERMLLIRRFEERLISLHDEGLFPGVFHVYIGQEVTAEAALGQLRADDIAFTAHRNHGHLLARGADPGRMFAEMLGRSGGYNHGKGGTLHLSAREAGFPHTSSIVGGILPLSVGAGLSARHGGKGAVSVCLFGDGAMEEGAFHESINIAKVWDLPVIFLCENNSAGALGASQGGSSSSTISTSDLCDIPRALGIPSVSVEGSIFGAVQDVMGAALLRAREGGGPSFIEARTVRWPGSRSSPPQLVATTRIEAAWDTSLDLGAHAQWYLEDDPVLAHARHLLQSGELTLGDIGEADAAALAAVQAGVEFALASPFPEPEEAFMHVFGAAK